MIKLPTSDAREQLADLVNRAAYGHERIVLTRHGKDLAVLVSIEDLAVLQAIDGEKPVGTPRGRRKAMSAEERKAAAEKGRAAIRGLQTSAINRGVKAHDEEIDAEVAAARKSRSRR
ncbi:MAG: type II toxin-antitoxin system Phd/YefM family antitoxin [Deltaproteobacteria bacterium]|nr:type II toxin-antitoxin system Phd/YefM family antitoxin [Deltaproteobacteria bacterium]